MPNYRPRMAAVLQVPVAGSAKEKTDQDNQPGVVQFGVRVRRAVLEQNDHNHADSLKLQIEWFDAGVDPRLLSNAVVKFFLGNADDSGNWNQDDKTLRFTGIATRVTRMAKEGEGFVVDIEFQDFTTLFLKMKPFPSAGAPDYTQTLDDAWRRICDNVGYYDPSGGKIVSSVTALRDALVPKGALTGGWPTLSKAVAARFAKLGKVHVRPGTDAWAVWQQCVGMLGLISYVLRDQVIVTTATDYYTAKNPPRLIWAKNILAWQESRRTDLASRGVGITSYDPTTGTTLEAIWPPLGDPRTLRKRVAPKKVGDEAATRQASDYEYFAVPDVTTPTALLDVAKRVYEERSRQELEGTARTAEMFVDTVDGGSFDLLTLASGDVVRVEFKEDMKEALADKSVEQKKAVLQSRGYSAGAADLIARNYDDITRLTPDMFVKRVTTSLETSADGGRFEVEINYANRIQISGDAAPQPSEQR